MSNTYKYLILFTVIILFAVPLFVEKVPPGEVRVDNNTDLPEVVEITCNLTDTVNASVKVALLPESEYTVNDKHLMAESVCGVLLHKGALIFNVTYEAAE